ncbi:MAG: flagellar basal-body MS-ring/collar protein FliF [Paracoccaceae bacterium]
MLSAKGEPLRSGRVQNLISIWLALDFRKKAVVLGATLAMFMAVLGLARMANSPNLVLLYAGLEGATAGQIVTALDQRAVSYEVRGDSIYVDINARDSLRMALAAEGLPATGGAGYELLDSLTGFGTTSQMFDAAYWRAKEGELARTILAVSEVKSARVHISQAPAGAFRRSDAPTASVTVTTSNGSLSEPQARALKHLVASAVAGMRPEDVQVIDAVGGLIASSEDGDGTGAGTDDRTEKIRHNVERLLEARVGAGKAVVQVSVDMITEREQITERKFDPQGRVAISTETEESSNSATKPGGDVTVASNLPEGDAGAGGNGKSQSTETRERVNYEVSETQREVLRGPGGVRRMTVAVLVDGQMVTAQDGTTTWQPRSEEELAILKELVGAAVGLDETRGDVLTLKSLQFTPAVMLGTEAQASLLPPLGPINLMSAIQIAVLAVVAIILGLFVVRPILASGRRTQEAFAADGSPLALPGTIGNGALNGEIDDDYSLSSLPMVDLMGADRDEPLVEDPATRLRRLIEERQAESIEILRGWLEPEEERV